MEGGFTVVSRLPRMMWGYGPEQVHLRHETSYCSLLWPPDNPLPYVAKHARSWATVYTAVPCDGRDENFTLPQTFRVSQNVDGRQANILHQEKYKVHHRKNWQSSLFTLFIYKFNKRKEVGCMRIRCLLRFRCIIRTKCTKGKQNGMCLTVHLYIYPSLDRILR
jgi:hypothetical protein